MTDLSVQRQMVLRLDLLQPLTLSNGLRPIEWWARRGWLLIDGKTDAVEALQQANKHKRCLVVSELLAKADTRTRVEGQEDERVGSKVFVKPLINEPIRVKLQCFQER